MASRTTLAILLGFSVVFLCLQLPQAGNIPQKPPPRGRVAGLAAATLLPALTTTFGLTLLLLFAHVRTLDRANAAAGGPGHRFVGRLAKATLSSTTVALLAGLVLWLVAADGRLGGADDVGWLDTK